MGNLKIGPLLPMEPTLPLWTKPPRSSCAFILLVSVLGASGCASAPADGGNIRTCTDANLDWAVGQKADEAVMRRLYAESGAGLVNPIGPDSVVRRDTRTDRLRVYIDKNNTIEKASCE